MPWSSVEHADWAPFASPTEMPPVAVAALADAVAARGQPPSTVISALRAELAEHLADGSVPKEAERSEEAAISRLELEMCHGPPRNVCAKCRSAPREVAMVSCGHPVLCRACQAKVKSHIESRAGMNAAKLCRLMCPICRGFERAVQSDADALFAIIDTDGSGLLEPAELLMYLLVAGQEPEPIADLFYHLDTNRDGLISPEEWRNGYERFVALALEGPARALQTGAPPKTDQSLTVTRDGGQLTEEQQQGLQEEEGEAQKWSNREAESTATSASPEPTPLHAEDPQPEETAEATTTMGMSWSLSIGSQKMELTLSVPATPRATR